MRHRLFRAVLIGFAVIAGACAVPNEAEVAESAPLACELGDNPYIVLDQEAWCFDRVASALFGRDPSVSFGLRPCDFASYEDQLVRFGDMLEWGGGELVKISSERGAPLAQEWAARMMQELAANDPEMRFIVAGWGPDPALAHVELTTANDPSVWTRFDPSIQEFYVDGVKQPNCVGQTLTRSGGGESSNTGGGACIRGPSILTLGTAAVGWILANPTPIAADDWGYPTIPRDRFCSASEASQNLGHYYGASLYKAGNVCVLETARCVGVDGVERETSWRNKQVMPAALEQCAIAARSAPAGTDQALFAAACRDALTVGCRDEIIALNQALPVHCRLPPSSSQCDAMSLQQGWQAGYDVYNSYWTGRQCAQYYDDVLRTYRWGGSQEAVNDCTARAGALPANGCDAERFRSRYLERCMNMVGSLCATYRGSWLPNPPSEPPID